jgi:hypothetical protein
MKLARQEMSGDTKGVHMNNDHFPSTRGMTDAEVADRQRRSQRVTRTTEQGPMVLRFPLQLLPEHYRWSPSQFKGRRKGRRLA